MELMTDFSEEYPRIKQQVESIFWDQENRSVDLDPRWGADVFVHLKSGGKYRITIETPEHIRWHMEQGPWKSHFEEGLVLVSRIDIECLLDVVENLLADEWYGLPFYGVPQRKAGNAEQGPTPSS
jgi:hypothetical protein